MAPVSVNFKTKDGENFSLQVDPDSKVEVLRKQLVEKDTSFENCNMVFKGKVLKDDQLCDMQENATVVIMKKKKKNSPQPSPSAPTPMEGVVNTNTNSNLNTSSDTDAATAAALAAATSGGGLPEGVTQEQFAAFFQAVAAAGAGMAANGQNAPAAPMTNSSTSANGNHVANPGPTNSFTIDPNVVDGILAMGVCDDRKFIEDMLRKTNGNADMALMWILEPQEMLRMEQEQQQTRRQQRQQKQLAKVNVAKVTEPLSSLLTDELVDCRTGLAVDSSYINKPYVVFFWGKPGSKLAKAFVQNFSLVYATAQHELAVVYLPAVSVSKSQSTQNNGTSSSGGQTATAAGESAANGAISPDENDESAQDGNENDQATMEFGEFAMSMPWSSLQPSATDSSIKRLRKRFCLDYAQCGSVLIEKMSGNVLSLTILNDLHNSQYDFQTALRRWRKRGHVAQLRGLPEDPSKDDEENARFNSMMGQMTGQSSSQGSSSMSQNQQQQSTNFSNTNAQPTTSAFPNPNATALQLQQQAAASSNSKPVPSAPAPPTAIAVLPGSTLTSEQESELENDILYAGFLDLENIKDDLDTQIEFLGTALKVLNNVYDKPTEVKFRSLKKSVAKLFSDPRPGEKVLKFAGFVDQTVDGDAKLTLFPENTGAVSHGQLGQLIGTRNVIQKVANKVNEIKFRIDRDKRIKEEMEKDKGRQAKYGGGDAGRMNIGADRHRGRGGGG